MDYESIIFVCAAIFVFIAWLYFVNVPVENGQSEIPENAKMCTDAQKAAEVCTMEYNPVCGDDKITYGNACSACASKNIDYYTMGEC